MKILSLDMMMNVEDKSLIEESGNNQKLDCAKKVLHEIIKDNLTDRQKQVLIMYFFEKRNIVEISNILKINKSTVSRTLKRAIENISKYLRYYKLR